MNDVASHLGLPARSAARRPRDERDAGVAVEHRRHPHPVGQSGRRRDLRARRPAALRERRFEPQRPGRRPDRAPARHRCGSAAPPGSSACAASAPASGARSLCACSRITLADHTAGVLVVAMEPAGPALHARRARPPTLRRQRTWRSRPSRPTATLIHATPEGRARLGGATTLARARRRAHRRKTRSRPAAQPASCIGPVTIERLGADATTVLVATFGRGAAGRRSPDARRRFPAAAIRRRRAASAAPDQRGAAGEVAAAADRRADRGTPPSAALRLADGRERTLHARLRRVHRGDRPAHRDHARPAVGRHQRRARARPGGPGRPRGGDARHLERHHGVVAGRRQRRPAQGRAVGPADLRPQPQLPRLSRLRRVPRRRSHRDARRDAALGRAAARAAGRRRRRPRSTAGRGGAGFARDPPPRSARR